MSNLLRKAVDSFRLDGLQHSSSDGDIDPMLLGRYLRKVMEMSSVGSMMEHWSQRQEAVIIQSPTEGLNLCSSWELCMTLFPHMSCDAHMV